jgi:integrase
MGQQRTVNKNCPEGMRPRKQRSGKIYYYLAAKDPATGKVKEIPLGDDFIMALQKYCEMVKTEDKPAVTWLDVVKRYMVERLPTKAKTTQDNEISRLKQLNKFFEEVPSIEAIEPRHFRLYRDWRINSKAEAEAKRIKDGKPASRKGDGQVAVNREITLFSTVWAFARHKDFTRLPCPADGVERFKERGRKDIYTEDEVLEAVYNAGDQALRDTLDLAYLTGQRRADVLAMSETMIRPAKYRQPDGSVIDVPTIPVKQEKTGNKVRMVIDGELAELIARIRAAKKAKTGTGNVVSLSLLTNEAGERLTMQMVRGRFEKAREIAAKAADEAGAADMAQEIRNFQFRDLRAKAGSDKAETTGSMIEAQKMLGHSAASTTEIYVRHRRGALVKPTR